MAFGLGLAGLLGGIGGVGQGMSDVAAMRFQQQQYDIARERNDLERRRQDLEYNQQWMSPEETQQAAQTLNQLLGLSGGGGTPPGAQTATGQPASAQMPAGQVGGPRSYSVVPTVEGVTPLAPGQDVPAAMPPTAGAGGGIPGFPGGRMPRATYQALLMEGLKQQAAVRAAQAGEVAKIRQQAAVDEFKRQQAAAQSQAVAAGLRGQYPIVSVGAQTPTGADVFGGDEGADVFPSVVAQQDTMPATMQSAYRLLGAGVPLAEIKALSEALNLGGGKAVTLSPGSQLIDPTTGRVITTAPFAPEKPEAPITVSPGTIVIDRQGNPIFTAPATPTAPHAVSPGGTLVDAEGKVIYAAPPAPREPKVEHVAPGGTLVTPEGKVIYTAPAAPKDAPQMTAVAANRLASFEGISSGIDDLLTRAKDPEVQAILGHDPWTWAKRAASGYFPTLTDKQEQFIADRRVTLDAARREIYGLSHTAPSLFASAPALPDEGDRAFIPKLQAWKNWADRNAETIRGVQGARRSSGGGGGVEGGGAKSGDVLSRSDPAYAEARKRGLTDAQIRQMLEAKGGRLVD